MQVEGIDFVTIPTRDIERSRAFYHETLGLPLDQNNPREVTAGQVTLAFWEPESDGIIEFVDERNRSSRRSGGGDGGGENGLGHGLYN